MNSAKRPRQESPPAASGHEDKTNRLGSPLPQSGRGYSMIHQTHTYQPVKSKTPESENFQVDVSNPSFTGDKKIIFIVGSNLVTSLVQPPPPKFIGSYELQQHCFLGEENCRPKSEQIAEVRWSIRSTPSSILPPRKITRLETPSVQWASSNNAKNHVQHHKNDSFYIHFFPLSAGGSRKYKEQAKEFFIAASTPEAASSGPHPHFFIYKIGPDLKTKAQNYIPKAEDNVFLVYSWRNNMLGIISQSGNIISFFSPDKADFYIKQQVDTRTAKERT